MRQWASKALYKISAHPWCLPIVSLRSQASLRPCEKSLETGQGVQLGQGNQFGQGGQLSQGGYLSQSGQLSQGGQLSQSGQLGQGVCEVLGK